MAIGRRDVTAVVPAFVAARVLVAVGYLSARLVTDRLVDPARRPIQFTQGLFAWDGAWYRTIAEHGYRSSPHEALRFFPFFPWVAKSVSLLTLGNEAIALVVVANVAALAALVLMRSLVLDTGLGEAVADRSVWVLALFPASFVMVWGYAESLGLVFVIGALYAARTKHWWWTFAATALAAATRPTGALIILAVFVEVVRGWSLAPPHRRVRMIVALSGPLVGAALVAVNAHRVSGDWWAPLRIQEPLRGDVVEPITRLVRAVGDLFSNQSLADGLHAPFALAFVALALWSFRRLPVSFSIYAFAVVLTALAADNLNSVERYSLSAFPLAIVVAIELSRRRWATDAVMTVLAGGVVALSSLAWLGVFVP